MLQYQMCKLFEMLQLRASIKILGVFSVLPYYSSILIVLQIVPFRHKKALNMKTCWSWSLFCIIILHYNTYIAL